MISHSHSRTLPTLAIPEPLPCHVSLDTPPVSPSLTGAYSTPLHAVTLFAAGPALFRDTMASLRDRQIGQSSFFRFSREWMEC